MARGKELPRDCVQLGRVQLLLDGRLDSSEQRAFESHLADCPACRAELRSMEEVRARLQRAAAAPLPAWDRAEVASRLPGGQASPGAHGMRIAWLWAPALGAAGLAGLLFWLWPSRPAPYVTAPERRIEIPAGERELLVSRASGESALGAVRRERGRWTLDRGAEIDLRPEDELGLRLGRDIFLVFDRGARLSVEQDGDGAWSVALDRGRAVARLRPGRRVPFCILAPAGRIEALGTAFEVEVQNGATELRLAEGRLALSMRWGQRFSLAAPIRVLARPGADLELGLAEPSPPGPLSLGERGDRSRLGEGVSRLGEGEPSKRLGEGEPSKRLGEGEPSKRLGEGETSKRLGEGETSKRLGEGEPSKRLDGEEPAGRQGGEEPAGRQGGEEPAGRQGGEEPAGRQGGEDLAGRQGVDLAHLGEGASSKRPGEEEPARQAEDPLGRIRSLLARRQIAKARGLLDAHLVRRPDDVRARMLLGDALRLGGQGAEALEAYRDVARRSRDAHLVEAAVYEMGLLQLHALGSPADALDTFTRLRKMQPGGLLRQELAFRLAECFLALDDFRRAERALRDYLRTYPQGVKAAEARALLDELHEKGWR